MITGELTSKFDRVWDAFWSGGISNPLEVIEQITYLLFVRRLDDLETLEERKARLGAAGELRFGSEQQVLRWSRFKNDEPAVMFATVGEKVFPFLRTLGGDGSTYGEHMKDARFTIPTPQLLSRVVDLLDDVPMNDRDTNGDLYEYLLSKIASAGVNGQFRTPRHIIKLMVDMMAPKPTDEICDPPSGPAGFLVAASEYIREQHPSVLTVAAQRKHFARQHVSRLRLRQHHAPDPSPSVRKGRKLCQKLQAPTRQKWSTGAVGLDVGVFFRREGVLLRSGPVCLIVAVISVWTQLGDCRELVTA